MDKFGEISWDIPEKPLSKQKTSASRNSFSQYFQNKFSKEKYSQSSEAFQNEYRTLALAISTAISVFENIPLAAAFYEWVMEEHSKTSEEIEDSKVLLQYGFIGISDSMIGFPWTLKEASLQDPNEIYDAIRCRRGWPIQYRERLVKVYQKFLAYLSWRTDGFVPEGIDRDRERTKSRVIKYDEFVSLAEHLSEKPQLVAKLLYFGGDRAVDEVLKVSIQDIDFKNRLVSFGSKRVEYPLHVFSDLKALIDKRTKGQLFLGRQNAPLNAATVFRNFKEAASKAGLSEDFSASRLTTSKKN